MMEQPENPERVRAMIEQNLPWLHKERWAQIAADLRERIDQAPEADRAGYEAELDRHYADRFHPETSRAALLAGAGIEEAQ